MWRSGDVAFGQSPIRQDTPKTQEKAGRIRVTQSLAGLAFQAVRKEVPRMGVGSWGGGQRTSFPEELQAAGAAWQSLPCPSNSVEGGCRAWSLEGPGGHQTQESGQPPRPVGPAARVNGGEGIALGIGEDDDPRAGTIDGDKSSLRVSKDDITQQPHAFHLELIGKSR